MEDIVNEFNSEEDENNNMIQGHLSAIKYQDYEINKIIKFFKLIKLIKEANRKKFIL